MTIIPNNPPQRRTGFYVKNAIGDCYYRLGGISVLGPPISNEVPTSTGNGYYQEFLTGDTKTAILWSKETGAHPIKLTGAIGRMWIKMGREAKMGFPLSGEKKQEEEYIQKFSSGKVFHWTRKRGTWIT